MLLSGSMVTDYEIEGSKLIKEKIPLITEVSRWKRAKFNC